MAITAGGVGSGLDVNGIVSQLMALERRPANLLEAKGREYESQLSAYGRVRSALSSFQSAMEGLGSLDKFKAFSASSSDDGVLTASADSSAAAGIYSLNVARLAQNHKMGSDESSDTATFTGDLTITIGADSMTINPSANTLTEIRDLINSDPNNPGVTATLINVDTGTQRLVLTSEEQGYDNRLQLSGSIATSLNLSTINQVLDTGGGGGPGPGGGGDTYVTMTDLADLDAAFSVDGYDIASSSNNVNNVIDGISFELNGLGESTLTLSRDDDEIKKSVQSFVDAYNELHNTINDLAVGQLEGDSSLRSIQSQIRNVYNTSPSGLDGSFNSLVNVGIKTDAKTGELSFDVSDLKDAMDTDFQSVADLFANDNQGFAFRLSEVAKSLLENENVVDAREDGLRARIDDIENRVLSWESRLELKEKALRAQFAALDTLVGSMQSTSAFLAQQLGQ